LDALKKNLTKSEETYTKEKTRLELEIKRLSDKPLLSSSKKNSDKTDDELKTLTTANAALAIERSALADEVSNLKKNLAVKTLQWDAEKVKLQTSITGKTSAVGKMCATCERLKAEISSLNSEVCFFIYNCEHFKLHNQAFIAYTKLRTLIKYINKVNQLSFIYLICLVNI